MQNLCIVLKNEELGYNSLNWDIADEFNFSGYKFDEIKIISDNNDTKYKDILNEWKDKSDNIFIVSPFYLLSTVQKWTEEVISLKFYPGTKDGAGIYSDNDFTVFLMSEDDGTSGLKYAKNICIPFLNNKYKIKYNHMTIRSVGAGLNLINELVSKAKSMSGDKLLYNVKSKYGDEIIDITYDSNSPKMLLDDVLRLFADGLGDTVYAFDNITLEERLFQILKLRGKRISVAESFTGGGVGRRIVTIPGASEVYYEGLNTYNEESKKQRLGVTEYTLKTLGAVSDETAYEMAMGLLKTGTCDISIATTGLAGPLSDKSGLPVGLVYIAIGLEKNVYVYRYVFDGNRKDITETAINYALFLAYRQLKNL